MSSKSENPISCFDLTIPYERYFDTQLNEGKVLPEEIKDIIRPHCKAWAFQLEQGEKTGYLHYQCRFSLHSRKRKSQATRFFCNLFDQLVAGINVSPTAKENSKNFFYVTKEETRVAGPWTDKDPSEHIPSHLLDHKPWYPWQKTMLDEWNKPPDHRQINIIVNKPGGVGFSWFCNYWAVRQEIGLITLQTEAKHILRSVYCLDKAKKSRKVYVVDLPRAVRLGGTGFRRDANREKFAQMFTAIEQFKGGYTEEDRYKTDPRFIEIPHVWVSMNGLPPVEDLMPDRWRIWKIVPSPEGPQLVDQSKSVSIKDVPYDSTRDRAREELYNKLDEVLDENPDAMFALHALIYKYRMKEENNTNKIPQIQDIPRMCVVCRECVEVCRCILN